MMIQAHYTRHENPHALQAEFVDIRKAFDKVHEICLTFIILPQYFAILPIR